jgi:serine/threonine protein phosphatase PrpC
MQQVNSDLFKLGSESYNHQVVGSTVVALVAEGSRCGLAWAGDSRIYRSRQGELIQLTRDHVPANDSAETVQDLSDGSELGPAAQSNIITRAVGADSVLELESYILEVNDDDLFLLCSDGLTKEVTDQEISDTLKGGVPAAECVNQLINLALERGARDNVSVVVVHASRV